MADRSITRFERRVPGVLVALVLAVGIAPSSARADAVARVPARRPTTITDVAVIDVVRGVATAPRDVRIVDGRIVAIEAPRARHASPRDRETTIDGRGRFLMPGLVDLHVHLFNLSSRRAPSDWSLPMYVANGVTSVREMASDPAAIAIVRRWRDEAASGDRVAPRIVSACVRIGRATPDEAPRQVDDAAVAGADCIKVFSEIDEPTWRATLAQAKRRRLPVVGHVPAQVSVRDAARAGQRTDEHLMQLFEACTRDERGWLAPRRALDIDAAVARRDDDEPQVLAAFDPATCRRVARALARSGQVQVPTLVLPRVESRPRPVDRAADPRWSLLRDDEQARWRRIDAQIAGLDTTVAARRWTVAKAIVGALHDANVMILAGTDAPMPDVYPGSALHDELEALVEAGLSPADALRAATIGPARFLGRDATDGEVAVGRRADLVLLAANPLADVTNTRRIDAVIVDGRVFDRDALDALGTPRVP